MWLLLLCGTERAQHSAGAPHGNFGEQPKFGLELQQSVLWSRSQAAMSKRIAQELSMEEPVKYEDAKSGQEIRQLLGCLEIK